LSVPDNARDTVLIHVSASNEGQERKKERVSMMKKTERLILTYSDACGLLSCAFIQEIMG